MTRFFIIIATILSMTAVANATTDQRERSRHNQQTTGSIDVREVSIALNARIAESQAIIDDLNSQLPGNTPAETAQIQQAIQVETVRLNQMAYVERNLTRFRDRQLAQVISKYNLPVSVS